MDEITRSVSDDDIDWSYEATHEAGKPLPAPTTKEVFESEGALALMLINDVVFCNEHWWDDEWPEDAKRAISINVNCNDVFAWGCADAEGLPYQEVENLYRMWRKDPAWGPAVWCMIKRNQMPQKPVEDRIRKAGIWNLAELRLGMNTMEAEVKAYLAGVLAPKSVPQAAE